MQKLTLFLFLALLVLPVFAITDKQIKERIIDQSRNSYSGRCACPYDTAKNGSSCGGGSAYSRAGSASVLCYPEDVTENMMKNYKKKHKLK